jgi:hypothetical protein
VGNRKDFQLEAKLFKLKLKQRRNVLGLGERIRGREKRCSKYRKSSGYEVPKKGRDTVCWSILIWLMQGLDLSPLTASISDPCTQHNLHIM